MPLWYGSDKKGPLAGVPYDGNLTKADGKGQWWEGLDPRDLYGPVHKANEPCPEFVQQFLLRVDDVLQKYHPDLLYFDDRSHHVRDKVDSIRLNAFMGMPDLIPQIAAHYYNSNLKWNNGRLDAVLNIKGMADQEITKEMLSSAVVNDFEFRNPDRPFEHPWQTDTSIGPWQYQRGAKWRTVEDLVHTLVDIVSKNGNMLLGVPLRSDGTPDEEEIAIVKGIAEWMNINGEAIYATRPWKKPGEGDLRFTRSKDGSVLYVISLAWPADGRLNIESLAKGSEGIAGIADLCLLGYSGELWYEQTDQGLTVRLPDKKPCPHAYALKITFKAEH
jgi:alpha-L-fucosidase